MLYAMRGLTRRFGQAGSSLTALDRLSLDVTAGEFLAVVGQSGCGKTTLLQLLGALDTDYEGELRFDGQELKRLSAGKRARLRLACIGLVLQSFQLIEALNVLDNIALPHWRLHGNRRQAEERARVLAAQFAMSHRLAQRPRELSIGEMQRTAVARAIVCEPEVVLADEPTASVDAENGARIIAVLHDIAASGRTVIVASHDPAVVASARRLVMLDHGRMCNGPQARA